MQKYEIKRINRGEVVHITFQGEIHLADMTVAIRDCSRLLLGDPTIRHLIFDCTNSTRLKLSNDDIRAFATQTGMLITIQKDLIMIGVLDKTFEFGLFRMWEIFVGLGPLNIAESQTHVVRGLDQAFQHIESLGPIATHSHSHTPPSQWRTEDWSPP